MFEILIRAQFAKYYTLLVSSTTEKYFMCFNIKRNGMKYMSRNMFDKNISFKLVTFKCLFYVKRCKYMLIIKGSHRFIYF